MGKCEAMDSIIDLLQKMASQGIPRDSNTFAAALNGCDINGAADLALQLLGEMEVYQLLTAFFPCNQQKAIITMTSHFRKAILR